MTIVGSKLKFNTAPGGVAPLLVSLGSGRVTRGHLWEALTEEQGLLRSGRIGGVSRAGTIMCLLSSKHGADRRGGTENLFARSVGVIMALF